jgi:hypothetical protein
MAERDVMTKINGTIVATVFRAAVLTPIYQPALRLVSGLLNVCLICWALLGSASAAQAQSCLVWETMKPGGANGDLASVCRAENTTTGGSLGQTVTDTYTPSAGSMSLPTATGLKLLNS